MTRVRVSTTVDGDLLAAARKIDGAPDSQLLDNSLRALLREQRSAEVDAMYEAYDDHPLAEEDEWGDLSTWHEAADSTRA